MKIDKVEIKNKYEIICFILVYAILFGNAIATKDSIIALVSAFCGITYTILAGKGLPICYLIGVTGSVFYCYLSYKSALWGNLILYGCYYIPMQITGFIQWNKHLKQGKKDIIKTRLDRNSRILFLVTASFVSVVLGIILSKIGDSKPFIDSITTVFSILGMYLTVKRTVDQWIVWIIVNGLSLVMWLSIASSGVKVYSTVVMWAVYFILAVYFYWSWKNDLQ